MTISLKRSKIDFSQYINYALIGYAFCLPISKAGVNFFEISMLLLWILQGDWKNKFLLYKKNLLIIGIILLITFSLFSVLWGCDIQFVLNYVAKYRHFLIILVIFSSLQIEYVHRIFSSFLLGMFLSEIISYGIFFEFWHYKNVLPSDPTPFMSHTDYSIYLAFTSILLLTRFIDKNETNFKLKIGYFLFFLSSTTNLFVNGGRTGQVTFIVLVFISFLMSFQNKLKAAVISLTLIAVIFMLAFNYSPNFHNRFNQGKKGIINLYNNNDYKGSFAQRYLLWQVGLLSFKDHFLIGTGIGNDMKGANYYAERLGVHADKKYDLRNYGDHHNTFITLSVQLGIFGLSIIILIFYALFRLKFRNYYYKILNITFIVGFFLWSFGGITFHTMNPMIFFSFFAGLFNKISYIENNEGKTL